MVTQLTRLTLAAAALTVPGAFAEELPEIDELVGDIAGDELVAAHQEPDAAEQRSVLGQPQWEIPSCPGAEQLLVLGRAHRHARKLALERVWASRRH